MIKSLGEILQEMLAQEREKRKNKKIKFFS